MSVSRSEFKPTGWAKTMSNSGGRRSYGVELTRLELVALGLVAAANVMPVEHITRHWKRWDDIDPRRKYQPPTDWTQHGLEIQPPQSTLDQLILNLHRVNSGSFVTGFDFAKNLYVGRKGTVGFAPVNNTTGLIDFSPNKPPDYVPTPNPRDMLPQQGYNSFKYLDVTIDDLMPPELWWAGVRGTEGPQLLDHWAYPIQMDTSTDVDLTRYWRSYWIARGAKITLEPPHAHLVVPPDWAVDPELDDAWG